jgi:8-oxo-dGTP pyrophosphatase MutT (NUDIX family)
MYSDFSHKQGGCGWFFILFTGDIIKAINGLKMFYCFYTMLKTTYICNNCNKYGHLFHQCKLPIISYGIIVFRYNEKKNIEYLMIRRKDSFGYIDFMRGKYNLQQKESLQKSIDEMSNEEKQRVLDNDFDTLWKQLWLDNISSQYKNEEVISMKKYDLVKNGIFINSDWITLKHMIENSQTCWEETEWEFPKGRRNLNEKDMDCAFREFEEETGIPSSYIKIIENVIPFEELFIGSNHKSYKHKYFLAMLNEENVDLTRFQLTEVSKVEWKTLDMCLESIRPYHLEKRNILVKINKMLQEYRLYI